jgi:hypothetical protein
MLDSAMRSRRDEFIVAAWIAAFLAAAYAAIRLFAAINPHVI